MTNEGQLDVNRLEVIFKELAKFENTVFQTRLNEEAMEKSKHNRSNRRSRKNQEFVDSDDEDLEGDESAEALAEAAAADEQQKWLDSDAIRSQLSDVKSVAASVTIATPSGADAKTPPAAASATPAAAPKPKSAGTDENNNDIPSEFLESNSYHPLSKGTPILLHCSCSR